MTSVSPGALGITALTTQGFNATATLEYEGVPGEEGSFEVFLDWGNGWESLGEVLNSQDWSKNASHTYPSSGAKRVAVSMGSHHLETDSRELTIWGQSPFNVLDFGAQGDGVTDDAPAFQAALDACHNSGGGAVQVPGGRRYLMASKRPGWTSALVIRDNTHLDLDPGAFMVRGFNGRLLCNFDGVTANPGYTGHGNIKITGGVWDGDPATQTGSSNTITFAHGHNITVRDVRFLNTLAYHAIEVNSSTIVRIQNCLFEGFEPLGGDVTYKEAVQIDGAHGEVGLSGGIPYDNTTCLDVVVRDCWMGSSDGYGPFGTLVGQHSYSNNRYHENIKVVNNTVQDSRAYGVRALDWIDSLISGNTIATSGNWDTYVAAISLEDGGFASSFGSHRVRVVDNIIKLPGAKVKCTGISAVATKHEQIGIQIYGNTISDYNGAGIVCNSPRAMIDGNYVRGGAGGYALRISGGHGQTIRMNKIPKDKSAAAIKIGTGVTDVHVFGNNCVGWKTKWINDALGVDDGNAGIVTTTNPKGATGYVDPHDPCDHCNPEQIITRFVAGVIRELACGSGNHDFHPHVLVG